MDNFDALTNGDTVRVRKSGKLYRVQFFTDAGEPRFRQWRSERQALYGPSFVRLQPANVDLVEGEVL